MTYSLCPPILEVRKEAVFTNAITSAITTAVLNVKGGVGKTFITDLMASGLAGLPRDRVPRPIRVLVIDLDGQTNATLQAALPEEVPLTIYDLLEAQLKADITQRPPRDTIRDAIVHSPYGYDIVPGDMLMSEANRTLSDPRAKQDTLFLKQALEPALSSYDWIFIDCPPAAGMVQRNAIAAADQLLVPCDRTTGSFQGLQDVQAQLRALRAAGTTHAVLLGAVLTNATARSKESKGNLQQFVEMIQDSGVYCFPTIPSLDCVPDSINDCVPVWRKANAPQRRVLAEFANTFLQQSRRVRTGAPREDQPYQSVTNPQNQG